MVVVVDGHLAEQDQVVAAAFELRRQGGGGRQSIGRDPVRLEQCAAVGAHGESRADGLLRRGGAERDHDDLA